MPYYPAIAELPGPAPCLSHVKAVTYYNTGPAGGLTRHSAGGAPRSHQRLDLEQHQCQGKADRSFALDGRGFGEGWAFARNSSIAGPGGVEELVGNRRRLMDRNTRWDSVGLRSWLETAGGAQELVGCGVGWQLLVERKTRWGAGVGWQLLVERKTRWGAGVGWQLLVERKTRWGAGVGWQLLVERKTRWGAGVGLATPGVWWIARLSGCKGWLATAGLLSRAGDAGWQAGLRRDGGLADSWGAGAARWQVRGVGVARSHSKQGQRLPCADVLSAYASETRAGAMPEGLCNASGRAARPAGRAD
jgi:hypothetical protein